MVVGVVGECPRLLGGVGCDGERFLAPIDTEIECCCLCCLCCLCHRLAPPVGYIFVANRARVLRHPGVSGLLPLQGFGLWFVWALGVIFLRA
jgi:hypothetical protein